MTSTKLPDERSRFALDQLRELVKPGTTVYTSTTYGRGQTDHVRLFAVKGGEIVEITFLLAAVTGRRNVSGKGIAFRGGGYSKGLEAADDVYHVVFGRPLDQSKWREL